MCRPIMTSVTDKMNKKSQDWCEMPLTRLNAVRAFIVIFIAIGYASIIAPASPAEEVLRHFGYDASWFGIQILFCLSGYLALRSLNRHGSSLRYLMSRALRNLPLLAVYTAAVILILHPFLCTPEAPFSKAFPKLALYFFKTVTLIDPGVQLPGLFDDAKYMCLVQGAIWTFRWGALAHIFMALGWRLGILKSRNVLLGLAIAATLLYMASYSFVLNSGYTQFEPFILGLRLGYAFLAGASLWGWQHKLPTEKSRKIILLSGLLAIAAINYIFMPWSPVIEVFSALFWTYLAMLINQKPSRATDWMASWPNLTLGIYIGCWPVGQTLVALYPDMDRALLILSTLGVTIVLAIISHVTISGHINVWASQALRRKVSV